MSDQSIQAVTNSVNSIRAELTELATTGFDKYATKEDFESRIAALDETELLLRVRALKEMTRLELLEVT